MHEDHHPSNSRSTCSMACFSFLQYKVFYAKRKFCDRFFFIIYIYIGREEKISATLARGPNTAKKDARRSRADDARRACAQINASANFDLFEIINMLAAGRGFARLQYNKLYSTSISIATSI
ncbi:hypothetical protein EVAR_78486_1 [Eumeta japonica]|uniref:Uncharacterized protein n=1 Tax=Eumeta variegata TaxID=151549 RepID=A0A4C1TYC5_EUMVA|nr:hypothetical protein EVAR_78486_1 [Eumeta japonica]